METNKYCIYLRVSTIKQEESGLGLDSQLKHIEQYVQSVGGEVLSVYREAKSGTSKKSQTTIDKPISIEQLFRSRPLLIEAAKLCNKAGATLISFDLDRLGRSVFLISYLQQVGINFICSISPNDTPMIMGIKASMGQEFVERIKVNTKKAVREKMSRGVKWGIKGKFNLTDAARKTSAENRAAAALENVNNRQIRSIIKQMNSEGKGDLEISNSLNSLEYTTAKGLKFKPCNIAYHRQKIKELRL